jgi:hypothetical protein
MGAESFTTRPYPTKTAAEAFHQAVEEAQWDHGHSGYTGTIAEKHSYVMMPLLEGKDVDQSINQYFDEDHHQIADKWGPAGCIVNAEGQFIFFGWASC